MRKIYGYILAMAIMCFSFNGCDFLEAPPTVEMNEDDVFADRTLCEKFITGIYAEGMPLGFSMDDSSTDRLLYGTSTHGGSCDEAESGTQWDRHQGWNTNSLNSSEIEWAEDPRVHLRWKTIRKCNILLERIDEVPYDPGDAGFNSRAKGEGHFMRALVFWEGVYRSGGLPIVDHRITGSESGKYPRNPFGECVDFIIADCDEAAKCLPDKYTNPTLVGRATRIAALALKARVLLYAASPLFNTDSPYRSLGGENDRLLGYADYDINRWKKAADAAKEAIDAAREAGYKLYDSKSAEENYEYVWTTPDNEEIILANKKYRNFSVRNKPIVADIPEWAGANWGDNAGLMATMNLVMKYEKKDGTPQEWNMDGGNDLMRKYSELDPRFEQTIAHHGAVWNNDIGTINFLEGGKQYLKTDKTRHLVRKWVPRTLRSMSPFNTVNVDWIVFRMAELYLNYAEALNEWQGPTTEAYDAVAKVRARSGMPAFPEGLSQEEFREKLRNERAVELAFEDHRFWDIRRWLIAGNEGVMRGNFYGMKISSIPGSEEIHYDIYVFETRLWSDRSYLNPIPQEEVNKGYILQNPGWE